MLLDLESGNIAVKPTPHVHPCIGTPPVPVQDICDQSQKTCAGSGYVLVRGAKESGKTSLVWTSGRRKAGAFAQDSMTVSTFLSAAAAHARF
jgi:hypothetical protein